MIALHGVFAGMIDKFVGERFVSGSSGLVRCVEACPGERHESGTHDELACLRDHIRLRRRA